MPKHVVPRSLAYSPHAKPALTPCLCRQVKSRQIAPLASSTGATEARIFFPHSKFDTFLLGNEESALSLMPEVGI